MSQAWYKHPENFYSNYKSVYHQIQAILQQEWLFGAADFLSTAIKSEKSVEESREVWFDLQDDDSGGEYYDYVETGSRGPWQVNTRELWAGFCSAKALKMLLKLQNLARTLVSKDSLEPLFNLHLQSEYGESGIQDAREASAKHAKGLNTFIGLDLEQYFVHLRTLRALVLAEVAAHGPVYGEGNLTVAEETFTVHFEALQRVSRNLAHGDAGFSPSVALGVWFVSFIEKLPVLFDALNEKLDILHPRNSSAMEGGLLDFSNPLQPHANRLQWKNEWGAKRDEALMMSHHQSLGAESPLSSIPLEVMQQIVNRNREFPDPRSLH
eukprot:484752-Rhodomonas_salina.1